MTIRSRNDKACAIGAVRAVLAVVLIAGPSFVTAQSLITTQPPDQPTIQPTGDLHADLVHAYALDASPVHVSSFHASTSLNTSTSRSVPLALALSAALPGAGQAYNKSWIRAGVFAALEVGMVAGYFSWRSQGQDGEEVYQEYAHQYWSPVKYANWLNDFSGYNGDPIQTDTPELNSIDFTNPDDWSTAQQATVRRLIDDIRAAEDQSIYLTTGAAFSHVLPYFAEQQYYELIGKYFQYAPGWSDYEFPADADAQAVLPEDSRFYFYDDIHEEANDFLRRARRTTAFLFVNHMLSAFDAAITARLHNIRLESNLTLLPAGNGEVVSGIQARVRF